MSNSRNPYHSDDSVPRLRRSVFAFIDILGYRQMIRDAEEKQQGERLLQELYRTLNAERDWLEEKYLPARMAGFTKKDDYALKAFTDNIVIGWPIRDDGEWELASAFFKLAHFQFDMTVQGFFVRGAISIGDVYVDEIAVFGNALTQAVEGEASLARDPRIILTNSAVEAAKVHLKYYAEKAYAPLVRDVLRDSDDQWFINYLDCVLIAEDIQGPFYDQVQKHKDIVIARLAEHKLNPPIFSKYAWVARYHNYFCDLHRRYFAEQHKIDTELFQAKPRLITEEQT